MRDSASKAETTVDAFLSKVVSVLPRIKSHIQLTGLIVAVAAFIATRTVAPDDVTTQLCGGAIGILILIFGLLFNFLPQFPESERGRVIITTFIGFCMFIVILVAVTGYLVIRAKAMPNAFDMDDIRSLSKLSEDTSDFLAQAENGGPQRIINSPETIRYYATTYDLLDRMSQRAAFSRTKVPCPLNAHLKEVYTEGAVTSKLPDDYQKFDCKEFQLYALRSFVDFLNYAHRRGGKLTPVQVRALGGSLKIAIQGTLEGRYPQIIHSVESRRP